MPGTQYRAHNGETNGKVAAGNEYDLDGPITEYGGDGMRWKNKTQANPQTDIETFSRAGQRAQKSSQK
jgi:hypothetical protein